MKWHYIYTLCVLYNSQQKKTHTQTHYEQMHIKFARFLCSPGQKPESNVAKKNWKSVLDSATSGTNKSYRSLGCNFHIAFIFFYKTWCILISNIFLNKKFAFAINREWIYIYVWTVNCKQELELPTTLWIVQLISLCHTHTWFNWTWWGDTSCLHAEYERYIYMDYPHIHHT